MRRKLGFLLLILLIVPSLHLGAIGDVITRDNASSLSLLETYNTAQATYSVAWMPDSTAFVYGMANGTVQQQALLSASVALPTMLGGHTDAVTAVDVSSDGRWIFSGAMDGTVRAWDAATGTLQAASGLSTAVGDPFILSVAARPGSPNEIAYAGQNSIVYQKVWNAPVRPGPPSLAGHVNFVFDVDYSPDGVLVATGGADASVRVWSYLGGTQQSSDSTSHTERVYDVEFTHGGMSLASAGQDRTVWMRPVLSPGEPFRIAEIPDLGSDTVINAIAFGLNDDIIAVGDSNGILRVYSIPNASDIVSHLLIEIDAHDDQIRDLALSPDGTMIATAGFDSTVKIWNVAAPVLGEPPVMPTTAAPSTGSFCTGAPPSYVAVGMRGRVTYTDGTPLRLRDAPLGAIVMEMAEGTPFAVIGGPICADTYTWWQIRLDSGTTGWSAEGTFENYFISTLSISSSIT